MYRRQRAALLMGETREAFLRRAIQDAGWSVKEFADKIGLPAPSVFTILKRGIHTTSIDNVLKMCDVLEIDFEMFVRNEQAVLNLDLVDRRAVVAQRLKQTRCLLRYRAAALADMIGVPLAYYKLFENASYVLPPRCFRELSQILSVSLDYLIGNTNVEPTLDGLLPDGEPEDFEEYDLGYAIRELRAKRTFTQEDLAERMKVSLECIEQWESRIRVPSTAELVRLCEVLSTADDKVEFLSLREYPAPRDGVRLTDKEVQVIEAYRKADEKDRQYADFALGLK